MPENTTANETNKKKLLRGYIELAVTATDENGYVHTIRTKTIQEVYDELVARLKFEGNLPDEYFDISATIAYNDANDKFDSGLHRNSEWPVYQWIACYPVTGNSEGHYIHVDIIDKNRQAQTIFLGKTFHGFERAAEIAAACARHLGA